MKNLPEKFELTSRIAARPDYGRTEPEVRTDDGAATITASADDFGTLSFSYYF